jgi:apolipoprotein N-acyltransferase
MYTVGFLMFAIATLFAFRIFLQARFIKWLLVIFPLLILLAFWLNFLSAIRSYRPYHPISIVGVQLEFPAEHIVPKMLDLALAKNTNAQIFVLSESTLDGDVPDSLKNWCRAHTRFLVVGGKDVITNDVYYNTVVVVGTNGEVVFKQAKRVPIQFFHDGLPASKQEVWNSPWGKIGLCICYDLSYTRVTDELVRQGAQMLIVPTMDVEYWGKHQHELHARVAPVRAAEYGVPIFRLASSGISQAISRSGYTIAQIRFSGNGDMLATQFNLPWKGALPLDRVLAPVCVAVTAIVTAMLLFLTWKEKRGQPKS